MCEIVSCLRSKSIRILILVVVTTSESTALAETPDAETKNISFQLSSDVREVFFALAGGAAVGGILGLSTLSFYPDWKRRTHHIGKGAFLGAVLIGSAAIFAKIFGFVEPYRKKDEELYDHPYLKNILPQTNSMNEELEFQNRVQLGHIRELSEEEHILSMPLALSEINLGAMTNGDLQIFYDLYSVNLERDHRIHFMLKVQF